MKIMFTLLVFPGILMAQISQLKRSAEQVIRYQCGACHIPSSPSAQKQALNIFNLDDPLWASKLSKAKKQDFLSRLKQRVNMPDLEISYLMPKGYLPLPDRPTKEEILEIKLYMSNESLSFKQLIDLK
jgi:hypothetical protein